MRAEFHRLMMTPSVQAEQVRAHGRSRVPASGDVQQTLSPEEAMFLAARNSFYLASVSETGWPYIQHRGGPPGFVHLLNDRQLAFADYPGNRQLLSAGNIRAGSRVAMFFMDYAARERLKIIGEADILTLDEAAAIVPKLAAPEGVKIERVFLINVRAFDWNCPKYITPRFTVAQIEEAVAPLQARIIELERALTEARKSVP